MGQKKVLFRLERDEDGYPPCDVESVWAEDRGDGTFEIDNIPFFARQAALGDVVEVEQEGEELFYRSTREPSGSSLLRVALSKGQDPSGLRSALSGLGCSTEQSHLNSLISVDVPSATDIDEVRRLLDDGCSKGYWDYEEPILRHSGEA